MEDGVKSEQLSIEICEICQILIVREFNDEFYLRRKI